MIMINLLDQALKDAGIPIEGVSINTKVTPPRVTIYFASEATEAQKAQANALVSTWDWTDNAESNRQRDHRIKQARDWETSQDIEAVRFRALARLLQPSSLRDWAAWVALINRTIETETRALPLVDKPNKK